MPKPAPIAPVSAPVVLDRLSGSGEALKLPLVMYLDVAFSTTPPAVGEAFDVMPEYSEAEG